MLDVDLMVSIGMILFNVCCHQESACDLVNRGTVEFLVNIWDSIELIKHPPQRNRLMECCTLAICNLASGRVNTARMVRDGATQVLVKISHIDALCVDPYITLRVTSALNHLLYVLTNHKIMVKENVITALVKLAKMPNHTVRQNCASALRHLTFNRTSRQQIVDSGAIAVILEETNQEASANDGIEFGNELMCELEAESWCNGSRGASTDGPTSGGKGDARHGGRGGRGRGRERGGLGG